MSYLRAFIGGSVGAVIGAAIWVAVGQFTGFEVGAVAIAVGALSGWGVKKACTEWEVNSLHGVVGGILALAAIVGAKYALANGFVNNAREEFRAFQPSDRETIACLARELTRDIESKYEQPHSTGSSSDLSDARLDLPANSALKAVSRTDTDTKLAREEARIAVGDKADGEFNAEIWNVAEGQWSQLAEIERAEYRHQARLWRAKQAGYSPELFGHDQGLVVRNRFWISFGWYDLLWSGLAFSAAFKLGSSENDGDYEYEVEEEDEEGE